MTSLIKQEYWGSLEEFYGTADGLGLEFPAPPEKEEISGMERRDFLKIMGASVLLATVACARRPVEKIIPYVNKPLEVTPGIANWYASSCQECASSCGVLVKTREGRPIKLEGNDVHPMNKGGLCARGQGSIFNLYDAARLRNPVNVARKGAADDISWAALDSQIKNKLDEAKSKNQKVVILTGALNSPSTTELIKEFISQYPGAQHVSYEGVVPEEIALAQQLSYGAKLTPRYRLNKASYILTFGADFLGTYLSPVEFAKGYSAARRVDEGVMAPSVAVESALSLTGTNADERLTVAPGDELLIALGIANTLAKMGLVDGGVASQISSFTAESVAQKTGVKAETIKKIAAELSKNRGKSVVLGGAVKAKNGLALQVVANLINSALDNDGATIDWQQSPSNQADSSFADLVNLVSDMQSGKIGALFLYKTNPVYLLPAILSYDYVPLKFAEALKKVPLVVSLSDRLDETAIASDYVAPTSHFLESWNDANPQKDIFGIVQPTLSPLFDTRSFQESLIAWGGITAPSWHDYIKAVWQKNVFPLYRGGKSFEGFWEEILQVGIFSTRTADSEKTDRISSARSFNSSALSTLPKNFDEKAPFRLSLYASVPQFDGRSANNPWLQELPEPVSKVTWDNVLSVSPNAAKKLNVIQGDVVKVEGEGVSAEIPVYIQPMLKDETVMMAIGYGRTHVGDPKAEMAYHGGVVGIVGQNVGTNVYPFQKIQNNFVEWTGIPVKSITKTGKFERLGVTQEQSTTQGRPVLAEAPFAAFLKDPHSATADMHSEKPISMWTEHEYKGYRWGMSIDTTACIGCNACMIGCQTENNIPVVGKTQVAKGRSMHWIRIDRYYKGDPENPQDMQVSYQPMMCQHCENAPCETVCPVIATSHSSEGLNEMVYNRCVGTRYCANNCPYKVRRFNFFGYSDAFVKPLSLVLNPDVTVRTRGVMEKCSFCIQRINGAKDIAKDEGRSVQDGELKTACQQSCPTDAIVFGNTNDPKSRVSKLRESKRGFHVLEELNVKPQVTYLAKIRNV